MDYIRPGQYTDRSPDKLDIYRVAPGDAVPFMSGERCEGKAYTDGDPGDFHRYTWKTRFPLDFKPNPKTKWNFWTQWHAQSNILQAPVALLVDTYQEPAMLQLRVWPGIERYHNLLPLEFGITKSWKVEVHWETDESGLVKVFCNGALNVVDLGPNCYEGDTGTYIKQGFYRGASDLGTAIMHGHLKVEDFS